MHTHAHVVYDVIKIMLEHDDIYNAMVGRSKAWVGMVGGEEDWGGACPHTATIKPGFYWFKPQSTSKHC